MKTLSLFILTSFFYILGISTLSAANWKVYVAKYKQDKTCKLVVEVDGFSFHENRPEQLRRDAVARANRLEAIAAERQAAPDVEHESEGVVGSRQQIENF